MKPQLKFASREQCYQAGQEQAREVIWAEISWELGIGGGDREKCLDEIRRLRRTVHSDPQPQPRA